MRRAAHMAESDPTRASVWEYLLREGRVRLVQAAREGRVAVGAISAELLARFVPEALNAPQMRPFIGLAVSAILEEEGFVLVRTGVRLRDDPVFTAGAIFRPVEERREGGDHPLLARIIDGLTTTELEFAAARIRHRLAGARDEGPDG
jgi:hypothetical protein